MLRIFGIVSILGFILLSVFTGFNMGNAAESINDNNMLAKNILVNKEYDSISWIQKGEALLMMVKINESIEAFDQALKSDPNNTRAMSDKASALNKVSRYDEALQLLNRSLELAPNDALTLREKALAFNRMGKYREALRYLNLSILIDPEKALGWKEKAFALNMLGLYSEALKNVNMSLLIDSKYAEAWHVKGVALERLGFYSQSNIAYSKYYGGDLYSAHKAAQEPIVESLESAADVIDVSRMIQ